MSISSLLTIQKINQPHTMEYLLHSINVAKLSKIIGENMGLTENELEFLHEVGLLHDIGKANIPSNIMWKRGVLTKEEKSIVNKHPIYSEQLIKEYFPQLEQYLLAAQIVRSHHENYDGTGYPDKLKGNEIPLYSRIIAIADMFDAITQPRIYRPRPLEHPLEVMESELGKKLDKWIFNQYAKKDLEKIHKNYRDIQTY